MKIDFEEFLREKHVEDNPYLLDDMIPDDLDRWFEELEQDDLIKYGQQYATIVNIKANLEGFKEAKEIVNNSFKLK